MFRDEYACFNGGDDLYAENVKILEEEGRQSLKVFFKMCKNRGIEPYKSYSGKFRTAQRRGASSPS
jgi:predicted HicB family RNase H-like nuclease